MKTYICLALALTATACTVRPPTNPNPPPTQTAGTSTFDTITCGVPPVGDTCPVPIAGVTVKVHTAVQPDHYDVQTSNGDGYNLWTEPDALVNSDLTFEADGYLPQTVGVLVKDLTTQHNIYQLYPVRPPLPPVPSRNAVAAISTTFQGLTVCTDKFGCIPWLDYYLTSPDFSAADRARSYVVKHAVGDTHQTINVSWAYREPGLVVAPAGRDLSNDLPTLRAFVREAIVNGFKVDVVYAGDGESNPPLCVPSAACPDGTWSYNDPVGDTYGFAWLMANFARLYAGLGPLPADAENLQPYTCARPGYDGVVPGWQPWTHVDDWLTAARTVVGPTGCLSLELSAGYWAWSGERDDYDTPAGLNLDAVLYEFPYPMGPPAAPPSSPFRFWAPTNPDCDGNPGNNRCWNGNPAWSPWEQVWQTSKRLLGSAYVRAPEIPADDDPGHAPDFRDRPGRGPLFKIGYEFDTYGFVRGLATSVIDAHRAYLRSIGWGLVG